MPQEHRDVANSLYVAVGIGCLAGLMSLAAVRGGRGDHDDP